MKHATVRRVISLGILVVLLLATACSHMVTMPPAEVETSAGHDAKHAWQIDTLSGERYLAKRYALTDSTLVIDSLVGADKHYSDRAALLPITIPREDIAEVSDVEVKGKKYLVVATGILVVFIGLAIVLNVQDE